MIHDIIDYKQELTITRQSKVLFETLISKKLDSMQLYANFVPTLKTMIETEYKLPTYREIRVAKAIADHKKNYYELQLAFYFCNRGCPNLCQLIGRENSSGKFDIEFEWLS